MVRIEFDKAVRKGGIEVFFGYIYPALVEAPEPIKNVSALSETIRKINKRNAPTGGWSEADRVPI
jgi:hypothetical protein